MTICIGIPPLFDDVEAAYLTTKDVSDPHFMVVDHVGQMISRELVRLEQYWVGRQRLGGVPYVEEHQIYERR